LTTAVTSGEAIARIGNVANGKFLVTEVVSSILIAASGSSVAAAEPGSTIDFNVLKVENLVVGKQFEIDQAFGAEYGMEVKSPFEVTVPTSTDFLILVDPAPKPGDADVKFNFGTLERVLTENLQFITMNTPDAVRRTKIGPYDAVEILGRYTRDPEGLVYLRIVGIPQPDQEASVFSVANVIATHTTVTIIDDMVGKTKSGLAMTTFRYIEP